MSRSIWKGPFMAASLRKRITKAKEYIANPLNKSRLLIQTKSRSSTILDDCIGLHFLVHKGNGYKQVVVNSKMVGHKFGEFAATRQRYVFKKKKKKK